MWKGQLFVEQLQQEKLLAQMLDATQGQSPGIAPWCPFIPQCLSKGVPECSEALESPS